MVTNLMYEQRGKRRGNWNFALTPCLLNQQVEAWMEERKEETGRES